MVNIEKLREMIRDASPLPWHEKGEELGEFQEDCDLDLVFEAINSLPDLLKEVEKSREAMKETEDLMLWLLGEDGDFPDLSQKPHYSFRTELRKRRDQILATYKKAIE